MASFGDRLRQLRREKGLTQEDFGKLIDNSAKTTVSGWERGERFPEPEKLKKIADLFAVSLDYLYCRTDYRNIRLLTDAEIQEIIPEIKTKVNLNIAVDGVEMDERTRRELKKLLQERGYL